jgi:hypothetical protein
MYVRVSEYWLGGGYLSNLQPSGVTMVVKLNRLAPHPARSSRFEFRSHVDKISLIALSVEKPLRPACQAS